MSWEKWSDVCCCCNAFLTFNGFVWWQKLRPKWFIPSSYGPTIKKGPKIVRIGPGRVYFIMKMLKVSVQWKQGISGLLPANRFTHFRSFPPIKEVVTKPSTVLKLYPLQSCRPKCGVFVASSFVVLMSSSSFRFNFRLHWRIADYGSKEHLYL